MTVINNNLSNLYGMNFRSEVQQSAANQQVAQSYATQPAQDVVEIQGKKKKKLSPWAKIGIGLGATIGALVIMGIAVAKHETAKINKLYKEKLIPKIFNEKLNFTEATTKEDAVKYAKEILGVKEIDEAMTLDAINFANHGITDVVNKNLGQQMYIPRQYFYAEKANGSENFLAYMNLDIYDSRFAELGINKKLFDDKWLTEKLNKRYGFNKAESKTAEKVTESEGEQASKEYGLNYCNVSDDKVVQLYNRFKESADNLTTNEKRILYYSINERNIDKATNNIDWIKIVQDRSDKIKLDIEKLKGLSRKEQKDLIDKYLKENEILVNVTVNHPYDEGLTTIYHEMGHLQDMAKNMKELQLAKWKIPSFKESYNEAKKARETGKKPENRDFVSEIDNRWGGSRYEHIGKILKENPETFKKLYPDLDEFLTNKETQKTAKKVSEYASTGIGEFIAETYRTMISGEKIPEDVLALYKKYNGPLPNGFS